MMDERTETRAETFRERTTGASVELPYAGIDTFLKSSLRSPSDVAGVDAAVLGVPYDGAVSNRPGTRYGPGAIREASAWWAYLSGYKGGLTNMRTGREVDFGALDLVDCGDVPVFPMDYETTAESVTAHVATVAAQGAMPVLLGGDHYCTFPSVRGFAEGIDADSVGVVQIDAHTDTAAESPVFGEHFHGSSTHHIADTEFCDYEHVAQVGIRGYESPAFFEFADETGLTLYTQGDVATQGIASVVEAAIDSVSAGTDAVYLTFDIDAVDPSVAPGTGTPEPGGLTADEALTVMETAGARDEVGAVDLMEVAPGYDPTDGTQRLAAYLLVTFLERQFAE
jgi:agmatinase|nr:agmatinase [Salinigranum halophilum]